MSINHYCFASLKLVYYKKKSGSADKNEGKEGRDCCYFDHQQVENNNCQINCKTISLTKTLQYINYSKVIEQIHLSLILNCYVLCDLKSKLDSKNL